MIILACLCLLVAPLLWGLGFLWGFIWNKIIKSPYKIKIEGRSLGSALILEFLLYYMTKPEYQLKVREEIYLDSTLDLF